MADASKVAQRYLTSYAQGELQWAADKIENVLADLEDVVDILDKRTFSGERGEGSLSDTYNEAAEVSDDIRRNISRDLDKHSKALRKLSRTASSQKRAYWGDPVNVEEAARELIAEYRRQSYGGDDRQLKKILQAALRML
jgi:hypothetical protein